MIRGVRSRGASLQDAILVATSEPASASANRFYAREFFEACRSRLNAGGVLGLRLRASENAWTPASRARIVSIHAALASVFPHAVVLPTPGLLVMVASGAALPQRNVVIARMAERGIHPRLATPEFMRYVYDNDRREEAERAMGGAGVGANSDASPVAFRYAMILWVGKVWPQAATFDPVARLSARVPQALGLVSLGVVAVLVLVVRRAAAARRIVIVFLAGLVGMLLEAVVLLYYQVTSGVLFSGLGVLLATFMAGLAAGSAMADRRGRAWGRAPGVVLLIALALAGAAIGAWTASGRAAGLVSCALALVFVGTGVGAIFGWASLQGRETDRMVIAPL